MWRLILIVLLLTACSDNLTQLEEVKKKGELTVISRNGPTTYYEGPTGPTGFEYDLAKMFADELGVDLKIVVPDNFAEIIPMVMKGEADFAAAGLTVTPQREKLIHFGPVYQTISQQVVYQQDEQKPSNIKDLNKGILEVIAGSSHVERLKQLKKEYPELTWNVNTELGSEELLSLVRERVVDYTIADSNEVDLNQRFYPKLKVAFDVSKPQSLAWGFAYSQDNSLYKVAETFFNKIKKDGELDNLIERYYGHIDNFDDTDRRFFFRRVVRRLPLYQQTFETAAQENNLDWRLLAAMGYQESHWDPEAISNTGVRGLMMLTRLTAKDLGIEKRTNPTESIIGGAKYFSYLKDLIPKKIKEPDRTWFALAAYNVGYGHLEDARRITKKFGHDENKWLYVRDSLPLLKQKKWYKKTIYGYARGDEPVRYVENIRTYYDLLVWFTDQESPEAKKDINALSIDSPVL